MKTKTKHGGKRKGAGAKPILQSPVVRKVYLDEKTDRILTDLGKGNLSLGIRLAGSLIEQRDLS